LSRDKIGQEESAQESEAQSTTSIGDGWELLAIQPDGKIIVVGEDRPSDDSSAPSFAVLRYNSDGSLDTTFGTGGVAIAATGEQAIAYSVAIQGDGKIVIGGKITQAGYDYFGIARYNTDGSLDTDTFGSGYVMIYPQ
jgi:uncharacterized delta-60 repeat protein